MAKREIPLFIVDTSRNHKRGECDFLVCTDKDNGFFAKVDYVDGEKEEVGDDYRIGCPRNGVSLRIQIYQMIGTHPNVGNIRTLLKKGMDTSNEFSLEQFEAIKAMAEEKLDQAEDKQKLQDIIDVCNSNIADAKEKAQEQEEENSDDEEEQN